MSTRTDLRILVIDDAPFVREFLSTLLQGEGYSVLCAANGREGLELYRSRTQEIGLVILDLILPVMDGHDCFEALKQENPDILVLLISGFSRDGEVQTLLTNGARGFMQKPFHCAHVLQMVAEFMPSELTLASATG